MPWLLDAPLCLFQDSCSHHLSEKKHTKLFQVLHNSGSLGFGQRGRQKYDQNGWNCEPQHVCQGLKMLVQVCGAHETVAVSVKEVKTTEICWKQTQQGHQ